MDQDFTDRRRHVRHATRQEAIAVLRGGLVRLNALIIDISESGARIELPETAELSEQFYLLIPRHRMQPCRLVWRDHGAAGVAYAV